MRTGPQAVTDLLAPPALYDGPPPAAVIARAAQLVDYAAGRRAAVALDLPAGPRLFSIPSVEAAVEAIEAFTLGLVTCTRAVIAQVQGEQWHCTSISRQTVHSFCRVGQGWTTATATPAQRSQAVAIAQLLDANQETYLQLAMTRARAQAAALATPGHLSVLIGTAASLRRYDGEDAPLPEALVAAAGQVTTSDDFVAAARIDTTAGETATAVVSANRSAVARWRNDGRVSTLHHPDAARITMAAGLVRLALCP